MSNLPQMPDAEGNFGEYGGQIIPPPLIEIMNQIKDAYEEISQTAAFQEELHDLYANYVGRPSPIYHAKNLSAKLGGAQIYLKREDLNHTGAHKINHCIGEALKIAGDMDSNQNILINLSGRGDKDADFVAETLSL